MAHDAIDADLFPALEQTLHGPETRSCQDTVAELLAEDFIEFGSSGRVYNKAVAVAALAEETATCASTIPEVSNFSVKSLSSDAVLVTYRSQRQPTAMSAGRQTLRSSVWTRIDGHWQMLFHQGTVASSA